MWIIDDDSMYGDEYQAVIAHFNKHFTIQYKKMEKNGGPGPCRNVVLQEGKSPWITFIDDDDIFINNPLINLMDADIIRSEVYNTQGDIHASFDSVFNCVLGTVFKREFLESNKLLFPSDLGVAGTEDSVFLLFALACTHQIRHTSSFITCSKRADSNYTLSSSHEDGLGIDVLPLCNICVFINQYKNCIVNKQIVWDAFKTYFITVLQNHEKNLAPDSLKQQYLIILHLVFFQCVLELFPTSEEIKPYIKNDSNFLPYLYCAYHFCTIENGTLYY